MFVELIGPSGTGKTTVARLLDGLLAAAGIPSFSFSELDDLDREIGERSLKRRGLRRFRALAPLFWRQPRLAFGILAIAVAQGPPFLKRQRRARRLLGHLLFLLRMQARAQERVIVLHEGFFQRLWSIVIESRELRLPGVVGTVLAEYHALVRPLTISLEIDDEVVTARVFARTSRGRFNRDSAPERRRDYARWLDYRSRMLMLLPPGAIAATVDASGDPAHVAKGVATVIRHFAEARAEVDA